ncbi:MAG: hypothetical protein LC798_15345 [Chloroflexi bacterium]|nr:hypothetical protein [Chloroflexota bacterium]
MRKRQIERERADALRGLLAASLVEVAGEAVAKHVLGEHPQALGVAAVAGRADAACEVWAQ